MEYVLASVNGNYIYVLHNKIYFNQKQAENALKVLKDNGKISKNVEVMQVNSWNISKVKE